MLDFGKPRAKPSQSWVALRCALIGCRCGHAPRSRERDVLGWVGLGFASGCGAAKEKGTHTNCSYAPSVQLGQGRPEEASARCSRDSQGFSSQSVASENRTRASSHSRHPIATCLQARSSPARVAWCSSRPFHLGRAAASLSTVTGAPQPTPLLLIHAPAPSASHGNVHITLRSSHRQ